mmetsp:Transcript_5152/g.9877  ORF Transcript_5152/g.9877 Transcript_5152/m.9877 type:complete len:209 (+) Transcript_5152:3-629(+)
MIHGPRVYFPSVGETVHSFQWKEPSSNLQKIADYQHGPSFQVLSIKACRFWNTKVTLQTDDLHHVPIVLAISYEIVSVEKTLEAQDPFQLLEPALLHDAHHFSLSEACIRSQVIGPSHFPTFCQALTSVGFRLVKIQVVGVQESSESTAERQAQREAAGNVRVQEAETVNAKKLEYLKGLQELGVDITKVLVASAGKVDFGEAAHYAK